MPYILILGVIISIVFYELTDITPGGIIVPGLMVMYFSSPLRILYTILVAIISFLVVKLLSNRCVIYGKRRFALLIIISFIIHILLNLILGIFKDSANDFIISLVGYTSCGIIASNYFKQGVIKTTLSLGIVVGVLYLLTLLFSTLGIV